MPGVGGDLISVFVKMPDGRTRNFKVATGGDNSRINGGRYAEDVEGNGDGSTRPIIRSRPGEREVVLAIDDSLGDHEFLLEASADPLESRISYTHISGIVYSHDGRPTGDMSKNDGNATATVLFKGEPILPG